MVSYIPGGGPYSTSLLYAICRVSETDSSAQDISLFEINTHFYYSFKIFSRFWLVKTTCIIHNNQLLFTKFGKNLHHIESMTAKVEPTENYWTQPAADYWTVDRENLGTRLCYIWCAEKKERNGKIPLRRSKYFEWIIKQLLNSAFIGYEESCRSWRVLSTSAFSLSG